MGKAKCVELVLKQAQLRKRRKKEEERACTRSSSLLLDLFLPNAREEGTG
jgi:hypothetical protein